MLSKRDRRMPFTADFTRFQNGGDRQSWLLYSARLYSELKNTAEVEGHVPQCLIAGNVDAHERFLSYPVRSRSLHLRSTVSVVY